MRALPNGYQENPDMDNVIVRRARKEHRCAGGHDGQKRTRCADPIQKGEVYIEYVGESPLYESGYHYHLDHAVEQGLIKERKDNYDCRT